MVKNHLKRLAAPKQWQLRRKGITFITRPSPGPHSLHTSIPLILILRDMLGYCNTKKEVRYVLHNKIVLVDGKRRVDETLPVGLFDTIQIQDTGENFRVVVNKKGKLSLVSINKEEANKKLCKIIGKTKWKGKTQIRLNDGRIIVTDKDGYAIGDSVLLVVPKQEINDHLTFDKGRVAMLIQGKHIGEVGVIQELSGNKITFKTKEGSEFETLKEYAFVIGKDKPIITTSNKK